MSTIVRADSFFVFEHIDNYKYLWYYLLMRQSFEELQAIDAYLRRHEPGLPAYADAPATPEANDERPGFSELQAICTYLDSEDRVVIVDEADADCAAAISDQQPAVIATEPPVAVDRPGHNPHPRRLLRRHAASREKLQNNLGWDDVSRQRHHEGPTSRLKSSIHMRRTARLLDALLQQLAHSQDDKDSSLRLGTSGVIRVTNLAELQRIFKRSGNRRRFDVLLSEYVVRLENSFGGLDDESRGALTKKHTTRTISIRLPDPGSRELDRSLTFRLSPSPSTARELLRRPTASIPVLVQDGQQSLPEPHPADAAEQSIVTPVRSPYSSLPGRKYSLVRWYGMTEEEREWILYLEDAETQFSVE